MLRPYLNIRTGLALLAIAIIIGTIFFSEYLSKKIERDERKKVSEWIAANNFIATAPQGTDITFAGEIQQSNDDIPVIWTNEKDSIIDFKNLDTIKAKSPQYLADKLNEFKKTHPPIIVVLGDSPYIADKYYYGESILQKQIRYFPIVQLLVVALFILIVIYTISIRNKSTQNQVWAGMARETAHQLGTPLTSLQGWIEILKDQKDSEEISKQMEKDVDRLRLISDRFGKIGSTPHLEQSDILLQIKDMVGYIKRIAPGKVKFQFSANRESMQAKISPPLFDWVIENLLKNALDAMNGEGVIDLKAEQLNGTIFIDISDNGKGMNKITSSKIFNPGFTTKKRGWGLGLTLSKRIIEQYHKGQLFVKNSEPGKGTTFRIVLKDN